MAKVNIEFDSNSKEMKVTLDGAELDDVRSVNIYGYGDDKKSMQIVMEREDVDGFEVITTLYANQESKSFASEDKTLVNIDKLNHGVQTFMSQLNK